jgi:hypothetical protein
LALGFGVWREGGKAGEKWVGIVRSFMRRSVSAEKQ